jgi:hypothetical protein
VYFFASFRGAIGFSFIVESFHFEISGQTLAYNFYYFFLFASGGGHFLLRGQEKVTKEKATH